MPEAQYWCRKLRGAVETQTASVAPRVAAALVTRLMEAHYSARIVERNDEMLEQRSADCST